MAINMHAPRQTHWWVWGGAAVAVILLVAALGYGFGWIGSAPSGTVPATAEQGAPATE